MKNRESLRMTADGYSVAHETIHHVIPAAHRHYEAYVSMGDLSSQDSRSTEEGPNGR